MSYRRKVGANSNIFGKSWVSILGFWLLISMVFVFSMSVAANNPPGIAITSPNDGATVSGTIVIWMNAWDADGDDTIQEVWVKIDGGDLLNATYNHTDGEGQWWYYEWDTTTVDDGWHSITAIAFDGTDDGSDLIEVFVDNVPENNPPCIEIVEPDHGATVSGTIVIWMVAWDADGNDQIQEVWVKIDGGDLLNATYNHTDAEGQWWYYEWDTTEVEDGEHHITAIVYDGTDDGSDTIGVIVDNVPENNPPCIEIVEPDHGATVSGTIVIWMVAWDPDGNDQIENVWVRFDGGPLLEATYDHTDAEGQWWFYEWDTTEYEDGWHDVKAIVYDGMDDGHDVIEVFVDNTPENNAPGIEIVEPGHGETVSGTVVIWMVAWDPDGNDQIENVWVRFDGGPLFEATYNHTDAEGQWWYYEWDTTEYEDGWHDVKAIVYDGIDDGHDIIEVYVDNTEENHAPGIEIVEPEHGATVSGTVAIWMVAWDPDGNDQIENGWVRIDSGDLRNATYDHTDAEGQWWYYEWDTTEVDDGWHDITAITYDGIDDASDVIEVFVENTPENNPPGIEITEPEHGATVSGSVVIWMVAWDPDGNDQIQNVWVRIDGGDLRNATYYETDAEGQWWYYVWDTTEVEDGWHDIKATVYDGTDDGHDIIEVYVDNSEPGSTALKRDGEDELLLALVVAGAVAACSIAALTEVGKFALLSLIFLPLYTKITKKEVLNHFVRGEIFGYIKVHPGDNYTTIKRNLGLKNGTLTYHLGVLEREGLVKSWSHNGYKYFYPKGVKVPGNGVKNPSIYDAILKSIKDSPGISVRDIAAVNGISRQLANYHVRKLAAEGAVELERRSFSKVCYPKEGFKGT